MTTSPKILTHNINCMNCICVMKMFFKVCHGFPLHPPFPQKETVAQKSSHNNEVDNGFDGLLDMLNLKVWSKHSHEAQGRMNTVIG